MRDLPYLLFQDVMCNHLNCILIVKLSDNGQG